MQRLRLISDFNIEILGRYLANTPGLGETRVETAPFGQVFQALTAPGEPNDENDVVVLWARAEGLFDSFAKALRFQPIDHEAVLDEVDRYAHLARKLAARVRFLLHPAWTLPCGHRGYGMLAFSRTIGLSNLVARMNLRLAEKLGEAGNAFVLDTEQWLRQGGPRAAAPKLWFASKVPFANVVFQEAAKDIAAALAGLDGKARKLVIVDLDNTMWGGVVGETGWQGIRLGGHDFVGEAFVEFQRSLKTLTARGVQLAIVSKNDEDVALAAIDRHPEMQLRREDFAGWRINWSDKAGNIADLMNELRLGIDSAVFIDDNPAERGRIREAFGDAILVPEWPADPAEFAGALLGLRCFDAPAISAEDRARSGMYAAERKRRELSDRVGSVEDWLASLQMEVRVEPLHPANLARTAQLFNKTNQMNMCTRRLSDAELEAWAAGPGRMLWTFRVTDRFGDSGLTGIISTEAGGDTARVVDFLMSCRVMGRKVEEAMLAVAIEHARSVAGVRRLVAEFVPTERNRPCANFLRRSGLAEQPENVFSWDLARAYPTPSFISVVRCEPEPLAAPGR